MSRIKADIELSIDQDGRIVFALVEPLTNEMTRFALLPGTAVEVGNALVSLGRGRLDLAARFGSPPSLN